MEGILALSVPLVFIVTVGFITRVISTNRVRREMISANVVPELAEKVFLVPIENLDANLKWGIVFIAVGVALGLVQLLGLDERDPLTWGILSIFGGAGLLTFYRLKLTTD